MADFADQSQAAGDLFLKECLAKAQQAPVSVVDIVNCTSCGCRIPEARRHAVPGCHLCVSCQQLEERQR